MSHFVISLNVNEQDLSYLLGQIPILDPKGLLNNFTPKHLQVTEIKHQPLRSIDLVAVYVRNYEPDSHNDDILCEQNSILANESVLSLSQKDHKRILECSETYTECPLPIN